jgi:hypothetical protein
MIPCDLRDLAIVHVDLWAVTIAGDEAAHVSALPAVIYADGTVLTEWAFTDEERARVLAGERVRLWIRTGGAPIQPVMLEVTKEEDA